MFCFCLLLSILSCLFFLTLLLRSLFLTTPHLFLFLITLFSLSGCPVLPVVILFPFGLSYLLLISHSASFLLFHLLLFFSFSSLCLVFALLPSLCVVHFFLHFVPFLPSSFFRAFSSLFNNDILLLSMISVSSSPLSYSLLAFVSFSTFFPSSSCCLSLFLYFFSLSLCLARSCFLSLSFCLSHSLSPSPARSLSILVSFNHSWSLSQSVFSYPSSLLCFFSLSVAAL